MDPPAGRAAQAASTVRMPSPAGQGAQDPPTVPMVEPPLPEASSPAPSPLHVSSRIGHFALLRKVGEGGMGAVYLAYDEALDRKVAVKVLHPSAVDASLWLRREAQALARLSHPNVVPIYEIGEHAGRVFLAMEYVEGRTLKAYLREERSPEDVLRVFLQAGRGLCAAHAAGLVHRDFKPDNVLLGLDGRARVVDFGIAVPAERGALSPASAGGVRDRPIGASPNALVTPLTDAGALMGTPSFMSPEQFQGEHATPASDQFSFCVALYRAVYKQAPFEGDQLLVLMKSVVGGALRPPPAVPGVPSWLGGMLTRGLSTEPGNRYPDLVTLLDEIEAQLPRDPDFDASITLRDRRIVLAVLFAFAAVVAVYVALAGPAAYESTLRLVGLGGAFQVAVLIPVGLLWKRLRRNVQGRLVVSVLLGMPGMLIVHRLLGAALGTPPLHILVVDTLLVAVVFACSALVVDRRFGYVALFGLAAATASAFRPSLAPGVMTLMTFIAVGVSVYVSDQWR